ncbi:glycosyltransferase family 2 protein [Microbacterium esteraromaticum]|uniref:glycosyltransferase family 2 protein n=1 Tax=Microbacterium esteraromaticum TaxID=57043 RepID=UPI00117D650B|nr:glycosyltransferase family 2 protein [Microbacterium esteraromaticum]
MDDSSTAIVFVNYRDYSHLERFLRSQQINTACDIVVVDNTESDRRDHAALDRIASHDGVSVLFAANLGYLGAVRHAITRMPHLAKVDFLIVSNTDLMFELGAVVDHLDLTKVHMRERHVGVIAPQLVSAEGHRTRQLHLIEPPTVRHLSRLGRMYESYFALSVHKQAGDLKRKLLARIGRGSAGILDGSSVFAPHGALMIFTAEYLQASGGFDFPCFLYAEEIFVGLQAERAGLRCVYDEGIRYSHRSHGSIGRWPSRSVALHLRDAHRWAASAMKDRDVLKQ